MVPGTGRVIVEPDVAGAGIARRDMRTALVALNPVTDYSSERGPRVTGYQISNTVAVTVRDLGATGAVIDAALAAGASSLDGLDFHLDDPSPVEQKARSAAMEDARTRATTLAAAAGVTLGDVLNVVEGERGQGPIPFAGGMRALAMKAEAADTPVESGTQEVAISMVVTFAIA